MIAQNLRLVREDIVRICTEIKRNPAEITLIAVSKNFGIDAINEAFNAGQQHFGENKAQELHGKFQQLGNKITWHFIGTLQRNKVKYAVESSEYIHSVDSFLLASEISKRAAKLNKVQKVLLQVKTTDEETKSGFTDKDEIIKTAEFCIKDQNLQLEGLMTIGPLVPEGNENKVRDSFKKLFNLRAELSEKFGIKLKELSMGMTSDYKIAIEEGATMLRIGSAIFGQRNYSKSDSPASETSAPGGKVL